MENKGLYFHKKTKKKESKHDLKTHINRSMTKQYPLYF